MFNRWLPEYGAAVTTTCFEEKKVYVGHKMMTQRDVFTRYLETSVKQISRITLLMLHAE